jgi:hypothetical protein
MEKKFQLWLADGNTLYTDGTYTARQWQSIIRAGTLIECYDPDQVNKTWWVNSAHIVAFTEIEQPFLMFDEKK